MVRVLIAVGSNLGDSQRFVREGWHAAVAALGLIDARLSRVVVSRPAESVGGGTFSNAVGAGQSDLAPAVALARLLEVESRFGRTRSPGRAPHARTLDLDLLDWGGAVIALPELTLPHPRMHLRDFVLIPLADLEPWYVDARTGIGIGDLVRNLRERHIVPAAASPCP